MIGISAEALGQGKNNNIKSTFGNDNKLRTRMFFSLDISQSSKLKKEYPGSDQWQEAISRFYVGFEKHLQPLKNCSLWKINGDELVYTLDIKKESDVYTVIKLLSNSVVNFLKNENYLKHTSNKPIIKGINSTAWIAYFPIVNKALWMLRNSSGIGLTSGKSVENFLESSQYSVDFIGPSMDEGYRLTKSSKPYEVTLSATCAALLAQSMVKKAKNSNKKTKQCLQFYLDGLTSLKGVAEKYPVIRVKSSAITAKKHYADSTNEWLEYLYGLQNISPEQVLQLTKKYTKQCQINDYHQFIYLEDSKAFKTMPHYVKKMLKEKYDRYALESKYEFCGLHEKSELSTKDTEAAEKGKNNFDAACARWLKSSNLFEDQKSSPIKKNKNHILGKNKTGK